MDFKTLLEKYGQGRSKYCVRFNPADVFTKNRIFKNHRKFVEHMFQDQYNMQVIRHNHNYHSDGTIRNCGLIYARADSDIYPMVEVWGIEGVSVKEIQVVQEAGD